MWIKNLPEGDRNNSIGQSALSRELFFKGTTIKVSFCRKTSFKTPGQRHNKCEDFCE